MSLFLFSNNIKELSEVAKKILRVNSISKKFLFYGEMGVGKTTLIKELSLQLGVNDVVNSPTFSIVNEYLTNDKKKIYHFDFYRLNNESEAFDLGCEEYFLNDNYCFVEWPEMIPSLIDHNMVVVKIKLDGYKRIFEIII